MLSITLTALALAVVVIYGYLANISYQINAQKETIDDFSPETISDRARYEAHKAVHEAVHQALPSAIEALADYQQIERSLDENVKPLQRKDR